MTEDEAKTKACCAKLGLGPHTESWMPSGAACIGSKCMAWRWEPQRYEHHTNDGGGGTYINTSEDTNRYGVKGKALPREGFCGLAGRP